MSEPTPIRRVCGRRHVHEPHHWEGAGERWYCAGITSTGRVGSGAVSPTRGQGDAGPELLHCGGDRLHLPHTWPRDTSAGKSPYHCLGTTAAGRVLESVQPPTPKLSPNLAAADLEKWWHAQAAEEAEGVIPKAIEYGSHSLTQYGRMAARLQGRTVVDDAEAQELGCWLYLIGKIERWSDAVLRGDRPSDDTLHDIGVYVKMAQRVRAAGSWPGIRAATEEVETRS